MTDQEKAQIAAQGGTAFALGGPAVAGITAGASFLNTYLQAKAQEEMNRRQMLSQAAQSRQQGEQGALQNLMQVWRGAYS
jgi:hypothetical protein